MSARAWIESLTFNNDRVLNFTRNDVVVIVGPNNSGKTATLRSIDNSLLNQHYKSLIKNYKVLKEGSAEELVQLLEDSGYRQPNSPKENPIYRLPTNSASKESYINQWNDKSQLGNLSNLFCRFITAGQRLNISNPPPSINILNDVPNHPVQYLQKDDRLEEKLSNQFRRAFGQDLIVHRSAGGQVPLLIGERPLPKIGQDRLSYEYLQELAKLPTLQSQGDGMRSFVGVLLYTSVGNETILLIDEPEAFLHPPQARLLGRMLVIDKPTDRQLFLATHSGDMLRGILDTDNNNVKVIRIVREGNINHILELNNEKLSELWNEPLLRYSNILDGLFHEKVVLCESDSDCRFYAAVMDAVYESRGESERKPDIMFTHCGGKARLPLVIRALKELGVPVSCVADFDVLNDEQPLRSIIEATGDNWSNYSNEWKIVRDSINSKKPELTTADVENEINSIFSKINETAFPSQARSKIQNILKKSSSWSIAKTVGRKYVPPGDATKAYNHLLQNLHNRGLFIVEVGELESFDRRIGNHGPSWVNEVLKQDLKNDTELREARDFVTAIVS